VFVNVHLHTGDSHVLLPELLARFEADGRNVDFVLVDGDHSAGGVAQDMLDLLRSAAVGHTVIVMHDSMNEEVRRGLASIDYSAWPKVRYVELDCVSGFLFREPFPNELWGGLALVVVDAANPRQPGESPWEQRYQASQPLMVAARDGRTAALAELEDMREQLEAARGELAATQDELELHRRWLRSMNESVSWRITAPLRRAKARLKR
jgi:Methyltransferase domain